MPVGGAAGDLANDEAWRTRILADLDDRIATVLAQDADRFLALTERIGITDGLDESIRSLTAVVSEQRRGVLPMSDVVSALDLLDLAIGRADGIVADAEVKAAGDVASRVRERRGFLGETLVVALAGGTGSGKSSLLNAIAGRRIAETGVLRPTTEEALAWVPTDPEPGLVDLLGRLDIDARYEQDALPRLAIIDLPDHDSIVLQHHQIVERLLPEVDAVVWVFDPQKYRDPLIHEQYISQLLEYQDQFLFVLNQVDLLGQQDLSELRGDLIRSLEEDGVASPRVFESGGCPSDRATAQYRSVSCLSS